MSKPFPPVNENDHVHGSPDALVTLIEYGDFQCPNCREAFPVVQELKNNFGDQLRFVFRHFPFSKAHEMAFPAALAAEAAAQQGQFWEMHDQLFKHQEELSDATIDKIASELGLDVIQFKMALSDASLTKKVKRDFENGIKSGVGGTPTYFINDIKYTGKKDLESLSKAIEQEMRENADSYDH
jgi:protein-disulfide isomerase